LPENPRVKSLPVFVLKPLLCAAALSLFVSQSDEGARPDGKPGGEAESGPFERNGSGMPLRNGDTEDEMFAGSAGAGEDGEDEISAMPAEGGAGAEAAEPVQKEEPAEAPLWTGTISENISRPDALNTPVYPSDISIGILGPGEAPQDSYDYARRVLKELQKSKTEALSYLSPETRENLKKAVSLVSPVKFRAGGGRREEDGSVSFIFRFIGREKDLAGEIYIRVSDGADKWKVEDIITEDVRDIEEAGGNGHPYSWLPYDRFY